MALVGQEVFNKLFEKEREHWTRKILENISTPLFVSYDPALNQLDYSAVDVYSTAGDSLYEECLATQEAPSVPDPITPELEAANRTIAVLREGIDKANAEIMRLRDDLARRPAAFVEPPVPDKPDPFRDFTTDRRRMGPS